MEASIIAHAWLTPANFSFIDVGHCNIFQKRIFNAIN
jgi:hypothetical protein